MGWLLALCSLAFKGVCGGSCRCSKKAELPGLGGWSRQGGGDADPPQPPRAIASERRVSRCGAAGQKSEFKLLPDRDEQKSLVTGALHEAALAGSLDMVTFCLERGADRQSPSAKKALGHAISTSRVPMVETLLAASVPVAGKLTILDVHSRMRNLSVSLMFTGQNPRASPAEAQYGKRTGLNGILAGCLLQNGNQSMLLMVQHRRRRRVRLTDCTPHEALAAREKVFRKFFRLVSEQSHGVVFGGLDAQRRERCSVPPSDVRIDEGDKFEGPGRRSESMRQNFTATASKKSKRHRSCASETATLALALAKGPSKANKALVAEAIRGDQVVRDFPHSPATLADNEVVVKVLSAGRKPNRRNAQAWDSSWVFPDLAKKFWKAFVALVEEGKYRTQKLTVEEVADMTLIDSNVGTSF
ncbi:hypothetical protein DFJ73DRAFT_911325 [Zopfochytrium polystomum]|nr:hypothetical protein DFJ73DRAFT_911325 [Zopfochytrium polystomum]